jgi:hypothetical protein
MVVALAPDLLMLLRAQCDRLLAAVAALFLRLTRRSARLIACSALWRWRGFSTAQPSAVAGKTVNPASMPASLPVGGRGCVATAAREQPAYQPSASRQRVTVLGVPWSGRCNYTGIRPIFARLRMRPPSSTAPLPYCG